MVLFSVIGVMILSPVSADPALLPPDSRYVVVEDGHLSVDGQRQRFWAVTGKVLAHANVKPGDPPEVRRQKVRDARASTNVILDRLEEIGVNGIRLWEAPGEAFYTKDDGSQADDVGYFVAEAGRRGFRIWYAGMNSIGGVTPDDVDVLDDPASRDAWQKAVAEKVEALKADPNQRRRLVDGGWRLRGIPAVFWDARLEALLLERMKEVAGHYNQHTGLRFADDPTFAIWELSNEEWWVRRMVSGSWQRLPEYFRQSLFDRWHEFLLEKYGDHAGLEAAWGEVLPGERLDEGTILFAPMATATKTGVSINDASPIAAEAVTAMEQEYEPDHFPEARGRDVLEFLVSLHLPLKQRLAAKLKPLGKSLTLSPMIYDTGIGYQIQSQWLHQNADAVAHDAYINGFGPQREEWAARLKDPDRTDKFNQGSDGMRIDLELDRVSANDGMWIDWLRKPPGIASGVPWLEHNRTEGKPFLVYETQIQQPAKYRADFPLRLAALAAIQDWDWITWHYWGDGGLNRAGQKDKPFDRHMDITTGRHPQGYHFTYDEVQLSLMRAAAYVFRYGHWEPAPNPTTFVFGRKALYDPASMPYAGSYGESGMDMLQTVYEHGVRIQIDPTRENDEVVGPVVKFEDRNTHNPYRPTEQLTSDPKIGFFRAVAPGAVAYAGRVDRGGSMQLGEVRLENIHVVNAAGMFDPIDEDRPYFAVSVYSRDGKPLSESTHASISIASTSYNTGFELTGVQAYRARGTAGTLPVLVARPAATFYVPSFAGGIFTMRDFHGDIVAEGKVNAHGEVVISAEQPVWYIDLRHDR